MSEAMGNGADAASPKEGFHTPESGYATPESEMGRPKEVRLLPPLPRTNPHDKFFPQNHQTFISSCTQGKRPCMRNLYSPSHTLHPGWSVAFPLSIDPSFRLAQLPFPAVFLECMPAKEDGDLKSTLAFARL